MLVNYILNLNIYRDYKMTWMPVDVGLIIINLNQGRKPVKMFPFNPPKKEMISC